MINNIFDILFLYLDVVSITLGRSTTVHLQSTSFTHLFYEIFIAQSFDNHSIFSTSRVYWHYVILITIKYTYLDTNLIIILKAFKKAIVCQYLSSRLDAKLSQNVKSLYIKFRIPVSTIYLPTHGSYQDSWWHNRETINQLQALKSTIWITIVMK